MTVFVESLAKLAIEPTKDPAVIVGGHSRPGDGGGGAFVHAAEVDAPPGLLPEGDGVIVVPRVRGGWWVRQFDGPFNVRWFGATGDGRRNDTGPIQSALWAAWKRRQDPAAHRGTFSMPAVRIPSGVYRITKPLMVPGGVALVADGASILAASSSKVDILNLEGQRHSIEGLVFSGGRHHLWLHGDAEASGTGRFGSPMTDGPIHVRNCEFLYPGGPAFFHDQSGPPEEYLRASYGHLVIENCILRGHAFFWGVFDYSVIRSSAVQFFPKKTAGASPPLAVFNSGGPLHLDHVTGSGAGTEKGRFWCQGTGHFVLTGCAFGDLGLGGFRLCNAAYQDQSFHTTAWYRPLVSMTDSHMSGLDGSNLIEVHPAPVLPPPARPRTAAEKRAEAERKEHDKARNIPSSIQIRNTIPSPHPDGVTARHSVGMGLWMSDQIDPAEIAWRERAGMLMRLDGLAGPFPARRSSDPTSSAGEDLWPVLRHAVDVEPAPAANLGYSSPDVPASGADSLWFPGSYDLFQHSGLPGIGGTAVNIGALPDKEIVGGVELTRWGTGRSQQVPTLGMALLWPVAGTSQAWGLDAEPGEYTFSCAVRAAAPLKITFSLLDRVGNRQHHQATRLLSVGSRCQRVWFPFFHVPRGERTRAIYMTVELTGFRDVPTAAFFAAGLFAIHRGATPGVLP